MNASNSSAATTTVNEISRYANPAAISNACILCGKTAEALFAETGEAFQVCSMGHRTFGAKHTCGCDLSGNELAAIAAMEQQILKDMVERWGFSFPIDSAAS